MTIEEKNSAFVDPLRDESGKGALHAILGLVTIIVGIYLAFFVLGLVLKIVVLAVVAILAVFLFSKLVSGAKKLG